MGERNEMHGERVDLISKRQRLRVECEALRGSLRSLLPVHEQVDTLDGERIVDTAIALTTNLHELAGLNKKIGVLERELGFNPAIGM